MLESIRKYRIVAAILVLFEAVITGTALIFYYFNFYGFQEIPHSLIYLVAGLSFFLVVDCLFFFFSLVHLGHTRIQNDISTASLIGADLQEAYDFGEVGLVIVDDDNVVLWTSNLFHDRQLDLIDAEIFNVIPGLSPLVNGPSTKTVKVELGGAVYNVSFLSDPRIFIFKDITDIEQAISYNRDQTLVIGIISIDNFNDAAGDTDETADKINDIRNEITSYFRSYGTVLRRVRSSTYFCVSNAANLRRMEENGFAILETIREKVKGDINRLTLSCGFAYDMPDPLRLNDMAASALDVAMSRGGDQVIVSQFGHELRFFGGKTVSQEATSKVKYRAIADSLISLIKGASNVIVMGHEEADMDAIGSCLGIKAMVDWINENSQEKKIKCQIVYSQTHFETKARLAFCGSYTKAEFEKMIVTPDGALKECKASTLVIVVDVSDPSRTLSPKLIEQSNKVVVIDHHRRGQKFIEHPVLSQIEPSASSACELISMLIRYATANPKINLAPSSATIMLSGIFLDSEFFKSKATGSMTFEAAEVLKEYGADNSRAYEFLKDGYEEFSLTTKILSSMKTLKPGIVWCDADEKDGIMQRASLARAANQAMQIKGVNAVFVAGKIDSQTISLSCRSDGTVNVQLLTEKLGGGGHFQMAGCQFPNHMYHVKTIPEVLAALNEVLEEYLDTARTSEGLENHK